MSFVGSSELWGESSTARLCQILLDANDGMAQQVIENRTDLLDLLTLKDLEKVDDCGLSLPYLAVHYDRPDMIRYLHKRGLNLSKPCDPMEYGTPMFYAVSMGKIHIVEALDSIGVSVAHPCDSYLKLPPSFYAARIGDSSVAKKIDRLMEQEIAAGELFLKNFAKRKARRRFLHIRSAAITMQRYIRGHLDRVTVRLVRAGAITLDGQSMHSSESHSTSRGGSHSTSKTKHKHKHKHKHKSGASVGVSAAVSVAESVNLENSIDSLSVASSIV